ncbi:type II toxin-antitoxin system RelE/ParE family toxin [Marinomonas sp. FW-1]|uniref:type II toxin-antitoxin system RelE family toxin n=1 Tax=Marinomonas sp. FW-1 TaxID=2071621 RepID=UPI0010C003F2
MRLLSKSRSAKILRISLKKTSPKIFQKIESLADNPRAEGCIKLSGLDTCRVRQGLYRIIYQIRDDVLIINVIKGAHRSSVYKNN